MREHRSCWGGVNSAHCRRPGPPDRSDPQDFYATDIPKPVWNLKTNATCWRGLRDMAAVRREMGEPDPELETRAAQVSAVDFGRGRQKRRPISPALCPQRAAGSAGATVRGIDRFPHWAAIGAWCPMPCSIRACSTRNRKRPPGFWIRFISGAACAWECCVSTSTRGSSPMSGAWMTQHTTGYASPA